MASETSLAIGEIASRAGIRTSAIRFYERRGLLPEPERVAGRRRYNESTLDRLVLIEVAQRAGFSLAEVRVLLESVDGNGRPPADWPDLAARKRRELRASIALARAMLALLEEADRCDCLSLEGDAFQAALHTWARAQRALSPDGNLSQSAACPSQRAGAVASTTRRTGAT